MRIFIANLIRASSAYSGKGYKQAVLPIIMHIDAQFGA